MSWFNFLSNKRPAAQGFAPKKKRQELPQAFILEPILTPSGLLDGTDNPIDIVDIDISADQIADIDIPEMEEGFDTISDNNLEEIAFVTSVEGEETLEEIPFVTSLDDVAESEATDEALTDETLLNESLLTGLDSSSVSFESGVFTVGQTGEVSVDFLFDGGGYEGELAVFSLEGMEEFEPGSEAFIQEAASRALSDSELGHIVISDQTEGARFVGELGESDRNSGEYLGVKTVQMRPGDEFGFMLVPNNTVQRVFDNPDVGGAARPLFSMATANPEDAFHVGQIADVTGDGSTFVMEDLRVDTESDGDYNDVIFQVRGATGEAALMDEVIESGKDWRETDLGQALIDYAEPYITPDTPDDGELLTDELVGESPTDDIPVDESEIVTEPTNEESTDVVIDEPVNNSEIVTEPTTDESTDVVTDEPVNNSEIVTEPTTDESTDVATDESVNDSEIVTEPTTDSELAEPVQYEFPQENQPLVGIIDTGFSDNNPDIDYSRISLGQDRIDGDNNPLMEAGEGNEHGTHVLGIIGATQDNDIGVEGINDDAPIWVGRAVGSGQWAESLVEFVDAAQESGQPNAVVNLSMDLTQIDADGNVTTRYEFTPQERSAIEYARQNNVMLVVAAGNDGNIMSVLGQASQEFDNIMTVGAAESITPELEPFRGYQPTSDSGSGKALDLVADSNSSLEGAPSLSVATAKVTGAVSQVWAANPDLNYTQVIDILKRTATDLGQPNWDTQTGAGLLNLMAAIHLAKATKPEPYTVKPGQRTITDNFVSSNPGNKPLPGDPTHPAAPVPGIPETTVDTGGNSVNEATQLFMSPTVDIIDQVSSIDPVDVFRMESRYLQGADFSVLDGELSIKYLTPDGKLLGTQVLGKGSHKLELPANVSGEVLMKVEPRNQHPATYMLYGFESTEPQPFNIDLEFDGALTASQKKILEAAAKNVASLIGQGLPTAIVDGKIIDDINIKISGANLDGAGGTQARTKIDFMRYGSLLPAQSFVQLDGADIADLEQSGNLFDVAQHEFLHALGFGNLWEAKGLMDYAGTPLARYNGKNAVNEFQNMGGLTDAISLESEGDGSASLHWHEELFQDEIMTADLNGFAGGSAPISAVTIASLADLGYSVNVDRATPDYQVLGSQSFDGEDLTPEQIEAFRQLAEMSFEESDADYEYIAPIMPEVDPATVAPEIWAHATRFWKNGEYYDWVDYRIPAGDTLSHIALKYLGNAGYHYYAWIGDYNGVANYDEIGAGDVIKVPIHHPNYEWKQEQERLRREQELRERQEREERERKEREERLARDKAEQERKAREEAERQAEAERLARELEEQERKLREDRERRRREEERRKEEERLRELERQREIARQKGKGGQDWFFATRLPEFGSKDPFETKLTGETVGNLVPDDYYRFTLSRNGRITAELKQLLADADLVLYDVRNRPIAYSMREGITDEQIITDLIPGTYMLRVNSPEGVTTDYDLVVKFQHKLSLTQTGFPEGWRDRAGGSGGGGGTAGPIFSDPRIQRIYDTALANFAGPERAKANAKIAELQREKRGYEQEMKALLDKMNAEQRAKVHKALDDARNHARTWVDDIANPIKNSVDSLGNGIKNKADSLASSLLSKIDNIWDLGNGWIKDRKEDARKLVRQGRDAVKTAVNNAQSWLKGQLTNIQNNVNSAISTFFNTIKNAYRTGGEINQIIANAANAFRRAIDRAVRGANELVGKFKGRVLSAVEWTKNLGINVNKFEFNAYNQVVKPAVNAIARGVSSTINGIGNSLKGITNWLEPRTQDAVAKIVNAILGDKTGHLWNKIHGVDDKIAATRRGLKKAIAEKEKEFQNGLNSILEGVANVGREIVYSVRNGLQTTKLASSYLTSQIQEKITSIFNSSENILKGASSTISSLISEKAIDFAKKINPLQWGIEDIAASKLEDILSGNNSYLLDFKDNWVREHSSLLRAAAAKYSLSSLIMAGVAWNEAGGQPDYLSDDLTFLLRMVDFVAEPSNLPDNFTGSLFKKVLTEFPVIKRVPGSPPEQTSFGQIQMQVRTAAQELGYSPDSLTQEHKIKIALLLKNTEVNIELAAKHLASLRKIDFPGNSSPEMTDKEIKIVATRYNANNRADGSVRTLEQIQDVIKNGNTYGTQIIDMRDHLQSLLA